ncbi:MAG TPA: glycosyltransferase family 4 protein [Nitriliruptorales bacterium]
MMLSWEYPPKVVGGLGRHVGALSRTLVEQGHEVHVITRAHADVPSEHDVEGVHVHRVPEAPPVIPFTDLVPWVMAFNNGVQSTAARLVQQHAFDVVHAHDWLVAYAAAGIKHSFHLPLVATIHATEYGRHQGWLPGPMNKLIHQVEWWLTYESRRVITCSRYMRKQVRDIFLLPDGKVDVVPNAVAFRDFQLPDDEVAAFRRTLTRRGQRMVLFAGRLEYEKGVQTMLHALFRVVGEVGPTTFFIAGQGTYSDELRKLVRTLKLGRYVKFTGYLEDHELRLHYSAADVAVAPSIYEPFGLVAVEAMACGTPVIVSDTGGLREIVARGGGLRVTPEAPDELADAIVEVLTDEALASTLVDQGVRKVKRRFDWRTVARDTAEVYEQATAEEAQLRGEPRLPLRPILHGAPILDLGAHAI